MSKPVRCPRCHGPATMVDKAPPGESGDVIRCAVETECLAVSNAARDLESAHSAVADAAAEFTRAVGKPGHRGGEIKIPGYLYADLLAAVTDWKDAGQTLHDATIADAAARTKAA